MSTNNVYEGWDYQLTRPAKLDREFLRDVLVGGRAFPFRLGRPVDQRSRAQQSPKQQLPIPEGREWNKASRKLARVLIIGNGSLLGAGIQSLLINENNLVVFGTSPNSEANLYLEFRRFQPDIVVMDGSANPVNTTRLLSLLADSTCLRVVRVSANDDWIHIYDKRLIKDKNKNGLATIQVGLHSLS
ncbi:MAG: hypothetical protein ACE5E7_09560 [Anaerolineae bacterium]